MTWHVLPGEHAAFTDVPLPEAALAGIPHQRSDRAIVVRHDHPTWRALRERGMVLPSPLAHYRWPGQWTPRENQRRTAEFFVQNPRCICLNGMRTGKTMASLWASDYLLTAQALQRIVVVAPLSTHENIWERALFTQLPHLTHARCHGTAKRKREIAADPAIQVMIVNPDSLHIIAEALTNVGLVIVDEATAFKNERSRRWKALKAICKRLDPLLWLLTASPTPQSPLDAYGLVRLLHDKYVSALQWRDMTMLQVSKFKWVPKPDAEKTVATWLKPGIRYTLADCGDVPDVQYEDVPVQMSRDQQVLCDQLKDEAMAEFLAEGRTVTAANAAAVLSKILQVQCGGVYAHDAQNERVTHHVAAQDYFDQIEEYVREADTPVLVFAPFRSAVEAISTALAKAGLRVGTITGEVPAVQRAPLFDAVQAGGLDALVAVPSTMSHGVTLDRSSYVLWAGPPFRAEDYHQANGRVLMADSKKKIVISHIVTSGLAKGLYNRLESKARLQDAVLNLLGVD